MCITHKLNYLIFIYDIGNTTIFNSSNWVNSTFSFSYLTFLKKILGEFVKCNKYRGTMGAYSYIVSYVYNQEMLA